MPRFITREEWLAGIKGHMTASGDAGVWRTQSYAPLNQADIQGMAIHWPGGNGNFAHAESDPFDYFQQMQIGYRNNHGFDLGYSFGITPNGWVFEIRGMQYRPASQDEPGNNIDENGIANSILLACDLDGKITLEQRDSARWVIQAQRDFWNNQKLWVLGHREIGNNSTVCPGDVLVAQIHAGVFEPTPVPAPSPEVSFVTPEDKAYLDAKFAAVGGTVWNTQIGSLGTLGGGLAWACLQDGRAYARAANANVVTLSQSAKAAADAASAAATQFSNQLTALSAQLAQAETDLKAAIDGISSGDTDVVAALNGVKDLLNRTRLLVAET